VNVKTEMELFAFHVIESFSVEGWGIRSYK